MIDFTAQKSAIAADVSLLSHCLTYDVSLRNIINLSAGMYIYNIIIIYERFVIEILLKKDKNSLFLTYT
jgi:hypothetical protein